MNADREGYNQLIGKHSMPILKIYSMTDNVSSLTKLNATYYQFVVPELLNSPK